MLPAYFLVRYHDVMVRKWGLPTLATVSCIGGTLSQLRKVAMRSRSEQGVRLDRRSADEDRN